MEVSSKWSEYYVACSVGVYLCDSSETAAVNSQLPKTNSHAQPNHCLYSNKRDEGEGSIDAPHRRLVSALNAGISKCSLGLLDSFLLHAKCLRVFGFLFFAHILRLGHEAHPPDSLSMHMNSRGTQWHQTFLER